MRTLTNSVFVLIAVNGLCAGATFAGMSVVYPGGGNHVHKATTPKIAVRLTNDPIQNAGDFFLRDNVSPVVKSELAGGDTAFGGWTFDYATKWKSVGGTLTIDSYKARAPFQAFAGAELTARYNRAVGDPTNLRWIQLVIPKQPFDPDATYNANTGELVNAGPIAAATGPFIDPYPNDGADGGPFYWHGGEIAGHTGGANFDLRFRDFPQVPVTMTKANGLNFQLYLVEWDGATNVYFLDAINWGFRGRWVPTPGAASLATIGMTLIAVRRRRDAA